MTFGRQTSYNYLEEQPWYRPYYNHTTPFHPVQQAHPAAQSLKGGPRPQHNEAADPVARMEKEIQNAPNGKKSEIVIKALKTNPDRADDIMVAGLKMMAKEEGKLGIARLKADLVAFNPSYVKKLQEMPKDLTDTTSADLRAVGADKMRLAMLTGQFENSQLPDNIDLRWLPAAKLNLKGVTSAGMTLGHQQITNADASTKILQDTPSAMFLAHGVDTGHQRLNDWDFSINGSLAPAIAESSSKKVTPDGTVLQARQTQPQWALDGVIPDAPSPFKVKA